MIFFPVWHLGSCLQNRRTSELSQDSRASKMSKDMRSTEVGCLCHTEEIITMVGVHCGIHAIYKWPNQREAMQCRLYQCRICFGRASWDASQIFSCNKLPVDLSWFQRIETGNIILEAPDRLVGGALENLNLYLISVNWRCHCAGSLPLLICESPSG